MIEVTITNDDGIVLESVVLTDTGPNVDTPESPEEFAQVVRDTLLIQYEGIAATFK